MKIRKCEKIPFWWDDGGWNGGECFFCGCDDGDNEYDENVRRKMSVLVFNTKFVFLIWLLSL